MSKASIEIVWFKRDLRVTDHKPLFEASLSQLPVLPLYVVEPGYWNRAAASARHWHFISDCLEDLNLDCRNLGQPLLIKIGEVEKVLEEIQNRFIICALRAHEETGDDWTYRRDIRVQKWCNDQNINFLEYPTNGVVRGLKSRDNWAKIRNLRVHAQIIPNPKELTPLPQPFLNDVHSKNDPIFGNPFKGNVQKGGRREALLLFKSFVESRGKDYLSNMSSPQKSDLSCSRLSAHLSWGTISVKEVLGWLPDNKNYPLGSRSILNKRAVSAFKSRIAWRCHFIQKLEDRPDIEFKCMHELFEGMREPYFDPILFKSWCNGDTGYPFIDACMKFLITNGWITFRSRALLVSFASYNLWLDWRKTGDYLAQLFTDFEPGVHYSQLQMQSGVTGINAIRIYNPTKQSYDQDREGNFIKKWVPALKNVPKAFIHEPWLMDHKHQTQSNCIIGQDYPAPIVEYKQSYTRAKQRIKEIRGSTDFRSISKTVFNNLGSRKKKRIRSKIKKDGAQLSFTFDHS